MSTTKRPRQRQAGPRSASPPPPSSKRLKASHTPASSGLGFLVDEHTRSGRRLEAKLTNGVSRSGANRVDESHALAADESSEEVEHEQQKENEVIDISSGDESSDLDEDGEQGSRQTVEGARDEEALTYGHAGVEQTAPGADDTNMDDAEPADDPTFGDMLQARHPVSIDVQKSLRTEHGGSGDVVPTDSRQLIQPPTAGSLGTVLTQALKTNDKDLLESCFAMPDVNAIRATIQRQQSAQIAILLRRIAERIHKRPGRAGRLMIWIQWSLVTHGGYLANQPELMKNLKALAQVTRERANGLQPLLHLKGKLDLLSAQLEARRNVHAQSRAANADDMDNEQGVLYIEGQDTAWSSDDDGEAAGSRVWKTRKHPPGAENESGPGDADVRSGFINGVEDDTSADEDDERHGGVSDDEAEEVSSDGEVSDEEALSILSSDGDDEDSSEAEESGVEAVRPIKSQNPNRQR